MFHHLQNDDDILNKHKYKIGFVMCIAMSFIQSRTPPMYWIGYDTQKNLKGALTMDR